MLYSAYLFLALSLPPPPAPPQPPAPIEDPALQELILEEPLTQEAIYRGTPVDPNAQAWKFTARLYFLNTEGSYSECSSVFIAPDVILTAAHCDVRNNGLLTVELYRENEPEPVRLQLRGDEYAYRPHPNYVEGAKGELGAEDLAVVVLRHARLPGEFAAVDFQHESILAASLPGKPVVVVGTGITERNKNPDRLLFAEGKVSSHRAPGFMRIIFTNGQGLCEGDSGGPVLIQNAGQFYLSALSSAITTNDWAVNCSNVAYATMITAERGRWILSRIRTIREVLHKDPQN